MARDNKFIAGLVTGVLAGVAASLLLAPKTGRETRGFVKDRFTNLRQVIRRGKATSSVGESQDDGSEGSG